MKHQSVAAGKMAYFHSNWQISAVNDLVLL